MFLGNHSMDCTKWVPKFLVTIGDYRVIDNFYVVNVANTNILLGFQWLFSIGEHFVNYKIQKMRFNNCNGKQVVLKGMNTYPNRVVSSHSMRSILRHGDIEWDVKYFIYAQ